MLATNMLRNEKKRGTGRRTIPTFVGTHFEISRIKLESRLTEGPNDYYEAHWKLDSSTTRRIGLAKQLSS